MGDDTDFLRVFTNPRMTAEIREGQPFHDPVFLEVACVSADDLFALRSKVRQLRGEDGMYSKDEREEELRALIERDLAAFVKIFEKRMNMTDLKLPSNGEAYRMLGNIMEYEHAGE
jgi:hypothetical protein